MTTKLAPGPSRAPGSPRSEPSDSNSLTIVSDPVVAARAAFNRADEALEHALNCGDMVAAGRCNDALVQAEELFANAVPTTEEGVRLKFAALSQGLVIARGGESLTRQGADRLLLHLASLQTAWAKLRHGHG